jgi:hypothetical protein
MVLAPVVRESCGDRIELEEMMMRTISYFALFLLISTATISAHAQGKDQNIVITIKRSQTVEERVADSIKEKELREAAEEKLAAEKSARVAHLSPQERLARARTIYVYSNTDYFESIQFQNALRKRSEFELWQMAFINGWDKQNFADVNIEIDRPLFTFTFTYQITDRATGMVLSTGKVAAFDGNAAAPMLAKRFVEDVKKARGEDLKKK